MGGIFSYFFERLSPQKSDLTSNVTNVGRFVAFSAERNRSKVRTIGFYEIAIARNPGRDFLNLSCVLERDDTRKRKIAAEIERIVDAALDAKLSPIKRMLAEQTEAGPNLRDIIGGIGWIFGLIGVAAYFRRRP